MSTFVPRTLTHPTRPEWELAIWCARPNSEGGRPPIDALAILWGQFAVECARGAACWNWNLGNRRHVEGDGCDYTALDSATEVVDGQTIVVGGAFCAFPDLETGASEHLRFLETHYPEAFAELREGGDARRFVRALKHRGYFTGDATAYENAVASVAEHFLREFPWLAPKPPSADAESERPTLPDLPSNRPPPIRAGEGEHTPIALVADATNEEPA